MRTNIFMVLLTALWINASVSARPYVVSSANLSRLNGPTVTFNGQQTLAWNSTSQQLPQSRRYFLQAPLSGGVQVGETSPSGTTGECVALPKALTSVGATSTWRRGAAVVGGNVPVGTVVATFKLQNGQWRYANDGSCHAAVFRGYGSSGRIKLWSQNWPLNYRCIIKHEIGSTNNGVSDPRRYFVVTH